MIRTELPAAPLSTFGPHDGDLEVVEVLEVDVASRRLCELGVCVGKRLRVAKVGDPAILAFGESRFAMSAELLARVFVRPVN